MANLTVNEMSTQEWDKYVSCHKNVHHEQSSGYGQKRKDYGFYCKRIGVYSDGHLVCGAQILYRNTICTSVFGKQHWPHLGWQHFRVYRRRIWLGGFLPVFNSNLYSQYFTTLCFMETRSR